MLWLCLLAISISPSLSFDVSCCPENTVWQYSSNCSDGTKIRLDLVCPSSIFLLDPSEHDDNFTVIYENGTAWLIPDVERERIPADR